MTKRDELHVINGNLTVVTVDDEAPVEAAPTPPVPEPFGGKGDHDGNKKVGGAHPPVDEPAKKRRGRPRKT